ncbi:MAG: DNA-binding response regulator [Halomonadaceae bacterium]|nr:MAG: DNA-binding response regulator [Halomonadaceae bacterium]
MRIAVLEDEQEQAQYIRSLINDQEWLGEHRQCDTFPTGQAFLSAITHHSYDLLILDWQIPDMDGIQVLKTLRTQFDWSIPVLFVTQRDSEEDVIKALDAGADDYLAKPTRPGELVARIRALLRRVNPDQEKKEVLTFGPFVIDTGSRTIYRHDEALDLTDKDFDLSLFLFRNQGRLLTREMLLERVWGVSSDINTRTVDTHMSRLRRRLGIKPENGFRIKTIYQRGYRLEVVTPEAELSA